MNYIDSSEIVHVNSSNRSNGTNSDFTYTFDQIKGREYTHCCLLQASIPKTYFVIQDDNTNHFYIRERAESEEIIITLDIGNPSATDLATSIETKLNAVCEFTYSISIDLKRCKFLFHVSDNALTQPYIRTDNNNTREFLGLLRVSEEYYFVDDYFISDGIVDLSAESTLFIRSDIVINSNDNVLQFIPTGQVPFFGKILYSTSEVLANSHVMGGDGSNIYRFFLTDEDQHPINLNGSNIVFSLLLYKKSNLNHIINRTIKIYLNDLKNNQIKQK